MERIKLWWSDPRKIPNLVIGTWVLGCILFTIMAVFLTSIGDGSTFDLICVYSLAILFALLLLTYGSRYLYLRSKPAPIEVV